MIVNDILLVFVTSIWLYFLWSRRRYYLAAYKIRGPWGFPFLGIAHKICNLSELLYEFPKYAEANNVKTYFTWMGTIPTLYTMDPRIIESVVNSPSCFNKPPLYDVIRNAIGDGLVTLKAPVWNKHRKLLNPSFGYKVLLTMFTRFNDSARELCDNFDKCVNQGQVHITDYIFESSLKSSIGTTMGLTFNKESDGKILKNFEVVLALATSRIFRPWLYSDAMWSLTSHCKPFSKALTATKNIIMNLIEKKIKTLEEQKEAKEEAVDVTKSSHVFIDQAINIHQINEFTVEDIVSHANLMVLAAFETSATALYSFLVMIAIHPDIQERLFNEISSLYPSKELNILQEELKNMVYLQMCINETLRLVPPVPLIARVCSTDIPITDDISIPAGTQIVMDIFNLQRRKDIWGPDAVKFDPDNFLRSNMEDKHSCSFIPFSKGPRNCIGWQYAGMWLKVMLPHLIRRFRFSTTARFEDLKFSEHISIKYVNPPTLEIQLR